MNESKHQDESDITNLSSGHCVPCEGGVPPLDGTEKNNFYKGLNSSWQLGATELTRTFKFSNFRKAFAFATQIALLAESEGHHPDLEIGWGSVVVILTTHAAGGLTKNDFIMAAKIDKLA